MMLTKFNEKELKVLVEDYGFEGKDFDEMIEIYESKKVLCFGFNCNVYILNKKSGEVIDYFEDDRLCFSGLDYESMNDLDDYEKEVDYLINEIKIDIIEMYNDFMDIE